MRSPLNRFGWWYWGGVAKMVVEHYDEPTDAVTLPLITIGAAVGFAAAAVHVPRPPGLGGLIISALFGSYTLLFGAMAIEAIGATLVYATEPTEIDPTEVREG